MLFLCPIWWSPPRPALRWFNKRHETERRQVQKIKFVGILNILDKTNKNYEHTFRLW